MNRKYIKLCALLLAVVLLAVGGVTVCAAAPRTDGGTSGAAGAPRSVYVGGMPFGVKFYTEGILIVGFCDVDVTSAEGGCRHVNPARDAGLKMKDVIVKVNGETPVGAASLTKAVEESGGNPITLTVKRRVAAHTGKAAKGGDRTTELCVTVTVTPVKSISESRYKTGLWVRDSGAGIGTVTFIVPESNAFAGLGHGICDGDTGELIPMQRGQVTDVTVSGIERGEVGNPGAIKGYFAPGKTGSLLGNTECGVYGVLTQLPDSAVTQLPVGSKRDLCEGDATILCTLDSGKVESYRVKITSVDRTATGSKCFTLTVTDPALVEKTGGIVQGMSGSPVIQNGKLVGAVTHVLINDPTAGYGIFIENMMRKMPELLQ